MLRLFRLSLAVLVFTALFPFPAFAQILHEVSGDPFVSLLQYSDNEYIYVGHEKNPAKGESAIVLTKKKTGGEPDWTKKIQFDLDLTVTDAAILPDRTIIIAGGARDPSHRTSAFLLKTDEDGDILWTRHYRTGQQAEQVVATYDGGYLFTYHSRGTMLVKVDSKGDSIWSKKAGNGKPGGLAETAEAAYLLLEDEDGDIVLSSIGSAGEVLWKQVFGGDGTDRPADVMNASDNSDHYVFAGSSYSDRTKEDFFIGLLDCFGTVTWTKTFGGLGTDICYDLMQSSEGSFIAVGASNSFNAEEKMEFYAVKFDTHGTRIWANTFPGTGNEDHLASNVFETSYGSLLVAGSKQSGSAPVGSYLVEFIFPACFDLSFEADRQFISSGPGEVHFTNQSDNAGYFDFVWHFGDGKSLASNLTTVSHIYSEPGIYDVKLVAAEHGFGSVDSLTYDDYIHITGIGTSAGQGTPQIPTLNIHPNPFRDHTMIAFENPDNDVFTLHILDLNGKLVQVMEDIRDNVIRLNRGSLEAGIYFLELYGRNTFRGKLVVK